MIKLLIVDDSALMRRQLSELFKAQGDFEVHLARNGAEAVLANREWEPDVISLDINMPEMDGLTALSQIMLDRKVAVIMVSSLTEQGALATFEALNLGAVDYIPKPDGTISLSIGVIEKQLVDKVRAAVGSKPKPREGSRPQTARVGRASDLVRRIREERAQAAAVKATRPAPVGGQGVVIVGVSTGGPRTLEDILPQLPGDFGWPVMVAQHMPGTFTKSFADRLDQICQLRVVEVSTPMPLEAGTIYLGKGGADMVVSSRAGRLTVLPKPEDANFLWHPSVELMGRSVLEHCDPKKVVGVMLTGMGNDGSEAFAALKEKGARTIAESEESSVVFGMPKELIELGGASVVLPVERIAAQLVSWVGR
jgi:two-component system chemotaxis response regulator CheB